MRLTTYMLLFQCFMGLVSSDSVRGQDSKIQVSQALQMAGKNALLLDSINQLLVVFNETPESGLATLVMLEKKHKNWIMASTPMPVGIGRKGFAPLNAKREGDNRSPTGLFRLGQLFCYDKVIKTKMPFLQTVTEDKWVDDPNSDDYNRHVRGNTQAKSFEKLKLSNDEYKYCMVIEYNTHPVVKGMGSAIFLHLWEKEMPNSTSGCVVLNQRDMESILKWMNPKLKPSILMGNEKVLLSGF
jgi:L,D-peptidoglycan transpeptidase YkuD (ErfK/YbiS/YcfS/YnhG family)